jgi:hypothetical protein
MQSFATFLISRAREPLVISHSMLPEHCPTWTASAPSSTMHDVLREVLTTFAAAFIVKSMEM